MDDKHITEIVPDLDKMPDWAREAFLNGQFFDVAFKRVERLEAADCPHCKPTSAAVRDRLLTAVLWVFWSGAMLLTGFLYGLAP